MRRLPFLICAALGGYALAQEAVTYRPPARDFVVHVQGEFIRYVDGGCTSTPESRVPVPSIDLAPVQCAASRMRTRNAVGAAIDAGALE